MRRGSKTWGGSKLRGVPKMGGVPKIEGGSQKMMEVANIGGGPKKMGWGRLKCGEGSQNRGGGGL